MSTHTSLESKIDSRPSADDETSQSQYTSPPVTLRIGPDLQPYYVPEILLQSLGKLPPSVSGDKSIHLQDVDVDTGHVIVHFLYTGHYQILDGWHSDDDVVTTTSARANSEFKKALRAFVAAKKYKLATLQELAKLEIIRCGDEMSISHAAHAISKHILTELQDDAVWLQDLVLHKAEQAFEEDDAVFSTASFFSNIKNLKMAKLLGQRVAKLYHKRVSELHTAISAAKAEPNVPENGVVEEVDANIWVVSADRPVEGPSPPPLETECPVDDWASFGAAERKKKKGTKAAEQLSFDSPSPPSPVAEPEFVPDPVTEPVPVEEPILDAPEPVPEVVETAIDDGAPEDPWGSFSVGVGKKKKKKSKRAALLEEVPAPEPEVPSQTLEASEPVPEPEPIPSDVAQEIPSEAPPESIPDVVSEPAAAIEDSPVVVEPPLANEEEDSWGWGATLSPGKKKKRKKGKAVQLEAPPSPPPPPPMAVLEDLIEPEPQPEPEPALPVEEEPHTDAAGDVFCPWRYEHLTQNDTLKDCKQCELYVRRIAVKLHSAGLPDANGLVAR